MVVLVAASEPCETTPPLAAQALGLVVVAQITPRRTQPFRTPPVPALTCPLLLGGLLGDHPVGLTDGLTFRDPSATSCSRYVPTVRRFFGVLARALLLGVLWLSRHLIARWWIDSARPWRTPQVKAT